MGGSFFASSGLASRSPLCARIYRFFQRLTISVRMIAKKYINTQTTFCYSLPCLLSSNPPPQFARRSRRPVSFLLFTSLRLCFLTSSSDHHDENSVTASPLESTLPDVFILTDFILIYNQHL